MAKKMFGILGILSVLLVSLAMTSAAASENNFTISLNGAGISSSNPVTGTSGSDVSFTVTFETTNASYLSGLDLNWSGTGISTGSLSGVGNTTFTPTINIGSGSSHGLKLTVSDSSGTVLANLDKSVYYEDSTTTSPSTTTTICTEDYSGEAGDLELEIDVTNNGQGDDDEWNYLDEIVIEVTVINPTDDDIDDVMVELIVKDDNGNTVSKSKLDVDDDEEDLGRIKDDDEEVATFTIDEVPIDLDTGNYKLYIIAYSEGDEDTQCVSTSNDFTNTDDTYFEFSIESAEDTTIIVKDDIENVKTTCGAENVEVSFMVYNIGDNDEDKVLVTLENSQLGIYEKQVIDNLRDGKGKEVTFHVDVPETSNKYEKLRIYTYYDYDEDEDEDEESSYDESSEQEGDDFEMYLEIISCTSPEPTIQANLNSVAKIGENLIIKTKITNNGDDNAFTISASGYESWATLVSIDPQTTTISENGQQEVTIALSPTASGAQSFQIKALVDGQVYTQSLSVNIAEEDSAFSSLGLNELTVYIIIAIIAVLALIFLVLIVRIVKRPARVKVSEF